MSPRWRKIFGDLIASPSRSALVILCIAIGVVAVGVIQGARELLQNTLAASFAAAQPATITFNLSPFDDSLLHVVRRMDGITFADARTMLSVRVQTNDGAWHDAQWFALRDFQNASLDRLLPAQGAFPPPDGQIALERSSLAFFNARVGENLLLELPNGKQKTLLIAGTVHDIAQPSAFLTGAMSVYTTRETWARLGLPNDYNQLLVGADETQPRETISALATRVRAELEARGYRVSATIIPPVPGRLYFADSVQSMMLLLGALGVASVLSSAILVVTTMSALLAQQLREIGVMKAIGASTRTLLQMYLAMVLVLSVVAIALAIPLGALGAYALVIFSTEVLNLLPVAFAWTPSALLLQIGVGLLIPLSASLVPILSGSRITVREAITNYGLRGDFGSSRFDRVIETLRALPRPLLLSLRNTFRRKARLGLTLSALILSGAVFMAVADVRASMLATLEQMNNFRRADAEIILTQPQRAARIERAANDVPGVSAVEAWGWGEADMRRENSSDAERVEIFGVPFASQALRPTLLQGRWFIDADQSAMVVDAEVLKTNPTLKIGDRVILKRNGNDSRWQIIGVTRSRLRGPLAYVPYAAWTRTQRESEMTERIQIFTNTRAPNAQAQIVRAVEQQLKANEMNVAAAQTNASERAADESNFESIIGFLNAMGILLALVGGLGLMGTMGMNVLERTREIGVLRAIGAPTPSLLQIVLVEGILIGVLSFPFAVLLSVPLALGLNDLVGRELLQASLAFAFAEEGFAIWFTLIVGIAALASGLPAWNAIRLTVRNALAYE